MVTFSSVWLLGENRNRTKISVFIFLKPNRRFWLWIGYFSLVKSVFRLFRFSVLLGSCSPYLIHSFSDIATNRRTEPQIGWHILVQRTGFVPTTKNKTVRHSRRGAKAGNIYWSFFDSSEFWTDHNINVYLFVNIYDYMLFIVLLLLFYCRCCI